MLKIKVELESISPIKFGKHFTTPMKDGEGHEAYDQRCWRERLHYDENEEVYIPAIALKNSLSAAAKYKGEKIKGKGNRTYTQKFEAGILIVDNIMLGVKKNDVNGETLHVPADGVRGGSKRVNRIFPYINSWKGTTYIHVIDPVLKQEPNKVKEYLELTGQLIGLMTFRPAKNGMFGRFKVNKFKIC